MISNSSPEEQKEALENILHQCSADTEKGQHILQAFAEIAEDELYIDKENPYDSEDVLSNYQKVLLTTVSTMRMSCSEVSFEINLIEQSNAHNAVTLSHDVAKAVYTLLTDYPDSAETKEMKELWLPKLPDWFSDAAESTLQIADPLRLLGTLQNPMPHSNGILHTWFMAQAMAEAYWPEDQKEMLASTKEHTNRVVINLLNKSINRASYEIKRTLTSRRIADEKAMVEQANHRFIFIADLVKQYNLFDLQKMDMLFPYQIPIFERALKRQLTLQDMEDIERLELNRAMAKEHFPDEET